MFFSTLLHKVRGYIDIKIEGGYPEKFINMCTKNEIRLFSLRKDDLGYYASTFMDCENKLQPLAKKSGVKIFVEKHKGLPYAFLKHKKRFGFYIGAAIFVFIIVYFSGFVWRIEVNGNDKIDTKEILYALSDCGVTPGVKIGTFNTKQVEQDVIMEIPELSWLHINLDGNVAKIEVGERTNKPEIVADNIPCNINASSDAQIVNIQVYEGTTSLKPNDTVQEGEIVVSGVIEEPKTMITRYVHARANIVARTNHELSVSIPFNSSTMKDTGKIKNIYTFDFLNVHIPLYFNTPSGNYRRLVYKNPIILFGTELPIGTTTTSFVEYNKTPKILTKKEAEEKAKVEIEKKEKIELSCCDVISRKYTINIGEDGIVYVGNYVCEEDIGVNNEININFEK